MDALATLGQTLAFTFAAGVNLYATVAILGLAARFGWAELPPGFEIFGHDLVIGAAIVLYAIEFFADKIPWVDSAWDAVHTFIRPLGGALVAVSSLGPASPVLQGLVALAGGTIAAGSHVTKASTRAIVNTSPEPFSNWMLSLAEDVFAVTLGIVALFHPLFALAVVVLLLAFIALFARLIWRTARRWLTARRPS